MTAHTKLKPLSRDDILGVQDRRVEVVEVPEWGGTVRVRGLSGSARDRYESGMVKYDTNEKGVPIVVGMNSDNVRARLVAISIVDENDSPANDRPRRSSACSTPRAGCPVSRSATWRH
jgi:hypothetical protein